ncbi:hypothetical protein TB1_012358 [Malus domestica]
MGWSHELTIRSLLIDAEKTEWNASLIRGIFSEDKATLILSIPLSLFLPRDVLIWIAKKKGILTTKSAYHVTRSCSDVWGIHLVVRH